MSEEQLILDKMEGKTFTMLMSTFLDLYFSENFTSKVQVEGNIYLGNTEVEISVKDRKITLKYETDITDRAIPIIKTLNYFSGDKLGIEGAKQ